LAGGVGGVVDTSIPDTVRVGDEPIIDPIGPLDAAPLGLTEPLPHKEAATVTAVTASWVPPPPPPPRRSGGSGGSGGGGSAVLTYTNAARAANGMGGLSWNGTLASRSCSWATHLASINSALSGIPHSGNGARVLWWGGNVAYGPNSAGSVVSLCMIWSTAHRESILRPQYTMVGSCSASSATGRMYWVQQFGA